MRTPWIWSIGLGRWWGVTIRLHMFFVLFAAFILYASSEVVDGLDAPIQFGFFFVASLLVSIILHEIGHIVVARYLGGQADEMVIGPLGGLCPVRVPFEPHSELVAMMAGALVNVGICLICALSLAMQPAVDLSAMLNPFRGDYFALPSGAVSTNVSLVTGMKVMFWINWSMVLVNLIPCFPFDGGRALRSVLSFLWPELDARQSLLVITRLGKVVTAGLLLAASFAPQFGLSDTLIPFWFVFTMLAIFIYFNSHREELQQTEIEDDEDTVFGYDFSQGYTSLERSIDEDDEPDPLDDSRTPLGIVGNWLEKRRESNRQRQIEQEAEDEKRVDEILQRLHKDGMRSLSHEDRELLDRVSKRYRSRQE